MQHKLLIATLIAIGLAAPAQAQWKWRDAQGKVQYSDRPPPNGTPDKDVLQRPANATRTITVVPVGQAAAAAAASAPRAATSTPTKAEQEAAARDKQEQDREAAKEKEAERRQAELRRQNCARAQANLRELQSGVRITRTNEQGERVFMEDAQRQAEVERARGLITSECR